MFTGVCTEIAERTHYQDQAAAAKCLTKPWAPHLWSLSKLLRPPCDTCQHFCDLEQWQAPGSSLTIPSPYPIRWFTPGVLLAPSFTSRPSALLSNAETWWNMSLEWPFSLDGKNKFSFSFKSLFYSVTGLLASLCEELTHWKRPRCWKRLKAGGEGMRMRQLDGITDLMHMSLSKLRERVTDRGARHAAVHGVEESWTRLRDWTTMTHVHAPHLFAKKTWHTRAFRHWSSRVSCAPLSWFYLLWPSSRAQGTPNNDLETQTLSTPPPSSVRAFEVCSDLGLFAHS